MERLECKSRGKKICINKKIIKRFSKSIKKLPSLKYRYILSKFEQKLKEQPMSQIEKKNKTLTTIQKEKIESLKSKKKEFGRKQSERRKGRDYREGKTGSTLGERNDCHTWTQCVERLHSVARPSFFPLRQSSRLSVCVCVCVFASSRESLYMHTSTSGPRY